MWHLVLILTAICTITCVCQDAVHTSVRPFGCNTYSSCTQCVSSSLPCDWCIDGHRCTNDTARDCRNDILITNVSKIHSSYRSGPRSCPSMTSASDGTNEILVPYGVRKALTVKVHIIGQFIVQTRFVCEFNIEGHVTHVNAQLLADTIYCDATEFTYTSPAPNITASFAVIWGGSKPLDNPDSIHILIYRCNNLANTCSNCLALPERFGCGWCQGSGRCDVQKHCGVPSMWLNQKQTCLIEPPLKPNDVDGTTPQTNTLPSSTVEDNGFVAKNATLFDCYTYSSCTQCVSSSLPCDWCVDGHRCTNDTARDCRNDILITNVSKIDSSYRSGPRFCPSMTSASDGTNEILVPYGVRKALTVKVHIIGQFIVQTRFVCEFNIEDHVTHVNAQLLADTIYCDATEFTYTSPAPNITASFAVIWGGSKPLDNPDSIHILIYRCKDLANACSNCLALPERFGCGWCQGSGQCDVQKHCGVPSMWLNQKQTCLIEPPLKPNDVDGTTPQTDTLPSSTVEDNGFVAKNATSFDCYTYSSCTQCVSSSLPCDWCVDGHRCTNDTARDCRNDILITNVSKIDSSYRSGPRFCPSMTSASDGTNEILVPYGVRKALTVTVHIIGQFIVQTRFVCEFNIEGHVTHVNAQLLADTIYCDATEFTYTSPAPNITASFAVIWGGSKPLDNPDSIHILIYRCNDLANTCSNCLALPERFGCGWCQGSGRCDVQKHCGVPSMWLNQKQTCLIEPPLKPNDVDGTTPQTNTLPSSTLEDNGFVAKNATLFDCYTYSSCTQCVSSSLPCDWCVDGHRCTNDTARDCRNDILITNVSKIDSSYRSGPRFCPSMTSASDGTNEILVPYGVRKALRVKVHIIGQFIVQTRFVCEFNIEGHVTHVNAQLLADTIYCDAAEFTYTSLAPNITASFAVIWGGSKPLDNPDSIHILIYRCNDIANTCSNCLALPERFGCGWCQDSGRCEVQDQCSASGSWQKHTCPIKISDPLGPE